MTIFGLFIGIDSYSDRRIPDLKYATNDARTLHRIFASSLECSSQLLVGKDATARAVRMMISNISREAREEDSVVLFYSGHGATERIVTVSREQEINSYLVTFDAEVDDLESTAISMEIDVPRFFRKLRARNIIFFVDTCYSGQAGGKTFPIKGSRLRDIKPGFPQLDKIIGKGRVIVTASDATEVAFEDDVLQHGVFTYMLVDGLRGGIKRPGNRDHTTFSELFNHLQKEVPRKSKELLGRAQHPIYKGEIKEEIRFPLLRGMGYRSLLEFPHAFHPITVVVGDRREGPENIKSAGDIFAYSASPSDLSWILKLGLPRDTDIVSDKVFVVSDEEYLRERFGSQNLLVVGSPASNLLARQVNQTAIFPFQVDEDTQRNAAEMSDTIQKVKDHPLDLRRFAIDERNQEQLRFYMNQFRKGGFLDPTNLRGLRGFVIPPDKDYGVITLSKNVFAQEENNEFLVILAGGVHLPGTMQATRYLISPDHSFKERPLGGVFSVSLIDQRWAERLTNTETEWSTEAYNTPDGLIESFLAMKEVPNRPPEMSDSFLESRVSFIRNLEVIR